VSNYQFTADLLQDVLFRCGEPLDGASEFQAQALTYLNRAYQCLWTGGAEIGADIHEEWWWLRAPAPGILVLVPPYTNQVTIAAGGVDVAFAEPTPAQESSPYWDLTGWLLAVEGVPDLFRLAVHDEFTHGALDGPFTGASVVEAPAMLTKIVYPLADETLRAISPMRTHQPTARGDYEIRGVDELELDRDTPLTNMPSGVPDLFCPTGERAVRFNRVVGASTRVEYRYLRRPLLLLGGPAEEPIVPIQHRRLLADVACYFLFFDKNDDRADGAVLLAKQGLASMQKEHRLRLQKQGVVGQISPRGATRPPQAMTTSGLRLA
jgi:hypothetical protein